MLSHQRPYVTIHFFLQQRNVRTGKRIGLKHILSANERLGSGNVSHWLDTRAYLHVGRTVDQKQRFIPGRHPFPQFAHPLAHLHRGIDGSFQDLRERGLSLRRIFVPQKRRIVYSHDLTKYLR